MNEALEFLATAGISVRFAVLVLFAMVIALPTHKTHFPVISGVSATIALAAELLWGLGVPTYFIFFFITGIAMGQAQKNKEKEKK